MRLPLIALVVFAACATSGTSTPPPATEKLVIVSAGDGAPIGEVSLRRDPEGAGYRLPRSRSVLWHQLADVLIDLGLPVPGIDEAKATAATDAFQATRQLGREPLARYLDCGSDLTGPVANSHRVRLVVRTSLDAVSRDTTLVRTRIDADASPVEGRGGTMPCSSTGELERRIAELLLARAR